MELIHWFRLGYSVVAIFVLALMILEFRRREPTLSIQDLFWTLALLGGSTSMVATSLESVYFNDHLSIKTPLYISTTAWCAAALWVSRKSYEEVDAIERGIMMLNLNPKLYDNLKWITQILLPAFGSLYFGLSDLWDLPKAFEVVGSVSVLTVFLGTILGLSNVQYKRTNEPQAGVVQAVGVDPVTGHPDLRLVLHKMPAELVSNDTLTFKVDRHPTGVIEAQDTVD